MLSTMSSDVQVGLYEVEFLKHIDASLNGLDIRHGIGVAVEVVLCEDPIADAEEELW